MAAATLSTSATTEPVAPDRHRLFVYGSLRADINASIHQRFMGKCVPIGPAYFQGRMYIVDKRTEEEKRLGQKETTDVSMPSEVRKYPAAIPSTDPSERVLGIVYDIPEEHTDDVLRAMDEYEDCVGIPEGLAEYRREKVTVRLAAAHHHENNVAGKELETWMYVWAQEVRNLVRVESGDYKSVYVMGSERSSSSSSSGKEEEEDLELPMA